jgi:hypothetical protein
MRWALLVGILLLLPTQGLAHEKHEDDGSRCEQRCPDKCEDRCPKRCLQEWEYLSVDSNALSPTDAIAKFNELGERGWDMAGTVAQWVWFKRPR